jgi:hypothetical protein
MEFSMPNDFENNPMFVVQWNVLMLHNFENSPMFAGHWNV